MPAGSPLTWNWTAPQKQRPWYVLSLIACILGWKERLDDFRAFVNRWYRRWYRAARSWFAERGLSGAHEPVERLSGPKCVMRPSLRYDRRNGGRCPPHWASGHGC